MRTRLSLLSVCALLALALLTSVGCSGGSSSSSEQASSSGAALRAVAPNAQPAADTAGTTGGTTTSKGTVAATDRLVITNAAMDVRVDDLSAAVASIRSLTQQVGGSISQLTISDNSESPVAASGTSSSGARLTGPANASLTLRIPAKSLPDVQTKIAGLGKLVSQNSNESDVTQQHIDMVARLANLRAEEARLRALLNRAGSVSDLLSVERELSRVRGDIESMQAQLAYLEGQAAMATLTVSLDQPGPILRPSAGGWGLLGAVTTGVRGAALLVRELITAIIALSPLLVIGALIWWLLARRARKRRAQRDAVAQQAAVGAAVTPPTSAEWPHAGPNDATPRT